MATIYSVETTNIFHHLPLTGVPEYSAYERLRVAELNPGIHGDKGFPVDLPYLRRLDVLQHLNLFLRAHPNFPRDERGSKLTQLSLLEFRRIHRWFETHGTLSTGECIQALAEERERKDILAAAIEKAKKGRQPG